jgi:hypothetical protein
MASIDSATLAEEYGFTAAFLNANPELKKLFATAVAKTYSTDKFTAALQNTKWYKSTSDDERKWLLEVGTDPATAKQDLAQATTHAKQLMGSIGANLTSSQLAGLAYNIEAKGWTDDQAKYYGGTYAKLTNGAMSGDAETQYSNALQYAYSMGVTMSTSFYKTGVDNIEKGTATYADLQAGITKQAKAQYSQYGKQIDSGMTMQDIAQPYISQMGTILEVNPTTISAFDPTIKAALNYKDPTTGAPGSQPLWQFENTLRQDPRWMQTQNAQDSMMGTAHKVLQDFGMAT